MRPIFADQSYLEDQHILIAVIAKDADNESYGECVVSLRCMFSEEPKDFECLLHHQGEEVGKIRSETRHVIYLIESHCGELDMMVSSIYT
ncbi:hypothetical protein DPMN_132960 [Dreissena polymorpha]|uniref:Phosphatidylinositol 3,4,5-trisphosphate 5-phosphatase 1/2-like second C2 domain-containing protein n=1 Tax=Dreissena polymorpha TaxID=45954 RepID=A0A9D4FUC1_DREPO|nr:hypothetical protein DPMN_132960 [Dreissena polymorpha]